MRGYQPGQDFYGSTPPNYGMEVIFGTSFACYPGPARKQVERETGGRDRTADLPLTRRALSLTVATRHHQLHARSQQAAPAARMTECPRAI